MRARPQALYEMEHQEDITSTEDCDFYFGSNLQIPVVGSRVEVFWPLDGAWYAGSVVGAHPGCTRDAPPPTLPDVVWMLRYTLL